MFQSCSACAGRCKPVPAFPSAGACALLRRCGRAPRFPWIDTLPWSTARPSSTAVPRTGATPHAPPPGGAAEDQRASLKMIALGNCVDSVKQLAAKPSALVSVPITPAAVVGSRFNTQHIESNV